MRQFWISYLFGIVIGLFILSIPLYKGRKMKNKFTMGKEEIEEEKEVEEFLTSPPFITATKSDSAGPFIPGESIIGFHNPGSMNGEVIDFGLYYNNKTKN